jgi:hypothetical protein
MLARHCLLCRRVEYQYVPKRWGLSRAWRTIRRGDQGCEHLWTHWRMRRCRCGAKRHQHPAIAGSQWQSRPFVFPDLVAANEKVPAKYRNRKEKPPTVR